MITSFSLLIPLHFFERMLLWITFFLFSCLAPPSSMYMIYMVVLVFVFWCFCCFSLPLQTGFRSYHRESSHRTKFTPQNALFEFHFVFHEGTKIFSFLYQSSLAKSIFCFYEEAIVTEKMFIGSNYIL